MNRIESIKKKKHLSYNDIAKESGLTPTYIHLLAKNKRNNPSLEAMQKIASALNEKVEYVFQVNQ